MAPCNKVGEFLDGEANRIAKERSLEEAVMFLAQWRTQEFLLKNVGCNTGEKKMIKG